MSYCTFPSRHKHTLLCFEPHVRMDRAPPELDSDCVSGTPEDSVYSTTLECVCECICVCVVEGGLVVGVSCQAIVSS